MIGGIFDGHHLVLSVRTIEPVALSRRYVSLGFDHSRGTSLQYVGTLVYYTINKYITVQDRSHSVLSTRRPAVGLYHSRDTSLQTVHYSTKYYVQLSTDHFEKEKKRAEEYCTTVYTVQYHRVPTG